MAMFWVTWLVLLLPNMSFSRGNLYFSEGSCVNDADCPDTQACSSFNTCQDPCINLTCYGQGVCTVVNHLPSCVYNDNHHQFCNCSAQPKALKKTYEVDINLKFNWYDAFMHCQSKGTRLATVKTVEENNNLLAYIHTRFPTVTWKGNKEQFWISGTNKASSGSWKWMTTGENITFTYWGEDQPNNLNGKQHCLSYLKLKWNDMSCLNDFWFVCEKLV